MKANLEGKVAIITGASSGIGAQSAKQLAAEGAAVVLTGRREERLAQVASAIRAANGRAAVLAGDMASEAFCGRLVQFAMDTFGQVDILVCSAGMALRKGGGQYFLPVLRRYAQQPQFICHIGLGAGKLRRDFFLRNAMDLHKPRYGLCLLKHIEVFSLDVFDYCKVSRFFAVGVYRDAGHPLKTQKPRRTQSSLPCHKLIYSAALHAPHRKRLYYAVLSYGVRKTAYGVLREKSARLRGIGHYFVRRQHKYTLAPCGCLLSLQFRCRLFFAVRFRRCLPCFLKKQNSCHFHIPPLFLYIQNTTGNVKYSRN